MRSSVGAGGLSGGLIASFPDQTSSKVSLGYMHHNANANFSSSFGLFRNRLLTLSGVVGNHLWSLGFNASLDVIAQNFQSMDFASSWRSDKFTSSFNRSTNTSRISIGYEHRLGSEILVKSRVDSNGTVAGLFQYKWNPETFYRVSAEGSSTQGISFVLLVLLPLEAKPPSKGIC
ncbi:hypothetical protein Bca4012_085457 [Brassica carinata]